MLDPDALTPRNRLLFDYWRSLRPDGGLPARADFVPRAVTPALGRLMLFDVRPNEALVCRLMGTELARVARFDITGRPYEDFTAPVDRAVRLNAFSRVVSGEIFLATRRVDLVSGRTLHAQEMILPFGGVQENGMLQAIVITDLEGISRSESAEMPVIETTRDDRFFTTW
jgi:hypothetical protein